MLHQGGGTVNAMTLPLVIDILQILSPIIAVFLAYWLAIYQLRHHAKMQIYSRLMAHRGWLNVNYKRPLDSREFERALNEVPAVFSRDKAVMNAVDYWHSYSPNNDKDAEEVITRLMCAIAASIGGKAIRGKDYIRMIHISSTHDKDFDSQVY